MLRETQEAAAPTTALMRKAYARWAPVYDIVYDKLTEPAAREAAEAAMACGPRILEAGVGTGLSLGYYRPHVALYGVDLSQDMLRRARDKVRRRSLSHVKGLQVMDVCRLGYADGNFDAVVAQFLITLVPNPEGALSEFLRVLRPGGRLVICEFSTPPVGLVRFGYGFYQRYVMPPLVRLSSSNDSAYEYLNESINAWPDQAALSAWLREAGFTDVAHRNLTAGVVALHRGVKPV